MEGKVKFYNNEKSFGFITGDDGTDYFFHESGIEPGNTIREGNNVSFEIVQGDKGPKAEKVKLLAGDESESAAETSEEESEEPKEEESEEPKEEESEEPKEEETTKDAEE